MVMNARTIPEVLSSIKALPIDQAWFTGYRVIELEAPINKFITETDYDNYIITSDDLMGDAHALGFVRDELTRSRVATGYCNLFPKSPLVNLITTPIPPTPYREENGKSYFQSSPTLFMTGKEADEYPERIFRVYFAGFALTGMRREVWLTHPFKCWHKGTGMASDHTVCYSLQQDGIPIMAVRGAFSEHLGGTTQGFHFPLNIGKVTPRMTLARYQN